MATIKKVQEFIRSIIDDKSVSYEVVQRSDVPIAADVQSVQVTH